MTFCNTLILCLFSAKTFIKNFISLSKHFLKQMFSVPLNTPVAMWANFGTQFYLNIYCKIIIIVFIVSCCYIQKVKFLIVIFIFNGLLYQRSWLLTTSKNSAALFLLPNRACESSIYRRSVLGAIPNVKAVQDFANNSLIRQSLLKDQLVPN